MPGISSEPSRSDLAVIVESYNLGDMEAVIRAGKVLLDRYPTSLPLLSIVGAAHSRSGRHDHASGLFARVVALKPDYTEGHYNLGTTLLTQGRLDDAIACFRRCVAIDPEAAGAYGNLGYALNARNDTDEAIAAFRRAIAIRPDYAEAHYNLGNALKAQGKLDDAIAAFRTALKLNSRNPEGHNNLANTLWAVGRGDEAIASFQEAIALRPDYADAHSNLGSTLLECIRPDEAAAAFSQVIALRPNDADAYMLLGTALADLSLFDEAQAAFRNAIAIRPDHADALNASGHLHLLAGDFARGWPLYEWRKHKDGARGDRGFPQPLWLGAEEVAGKSVYVHHEQGLGDTIQFARYASLLAERGARVTFAVQNAMYPLLRASLPGVEVVRGHADPTRQFDFHVPLMSLPFALGTTVRSIPASAAYIAADPERVERWRDRLAEGGFRIGICWQGSTGKIDRGRSIPLIEFRGIAQMPGVRLISLHKGEGEAQVNALPDGMRVETLGPDFDAGAAAFLDSAAVITVCDLVITSDTSIAHLAGALGVPVWVVLPHVPDWRWLLDREDCPWYPTMRLFRQDVRGDWNSAFVKAEAALRELLAAHGDAE